MGALTRLGPQIQLDTFVTVSVTNPLSCIRRDGSGELYDFILVETGSFVGFAGAMTFVGSLTNKNANYSTVGGGPVPGAAYDPVAGFKASDPNRTLVSTVSAPNGLYVIPCSFQYFFPVCSAYSGSGNTFADAFGI